MIGLALCVWLLVCAWIAALALMLGPRVLRFVARQVWRVRSRDLLPLGAPGYQDADGSPGGTFDESVIVGAGLARNAADARRLLDDHGGDLLRVIESVPVRYRMRAPVRVRIRRALRRVAFGPR